MVITTVKISELPTVVSADGTDVFPAVQSGVTVQESLDQTIAVTQIGLLGDPNVIWTSATEGSDITGTGTVNNPYQTINEAASHIDSNKTTIIVQGDVYDFDDVLIEINENIYGFGNNVFINDTLLLSASLENPSENSTNHFYNINFPFVDFDQSSSPLSETVTTFIFNNCSSTFGIFNVIGMLHDNGDTIFQMNECIFRIGTPGTFLLQGLSNAIKSNYIRNSIFKSINFYLNGGLNDVSNLINFELSGSSFDDTSSIVLYSNGSSGVILYITNSSIKCDITLSDSNCTLYIDSVSNPVLGGSIINNNGGTVIQLTSFQNSLNNLYVAINGSNSASSNGGAITPYADPQFAQDQISGQSQSNTYSVSIAAGLYEIPALTIKPFTSFDGQNSFMTNLSINSGTGNLTLDIPSWTGNQGSCYISGLGFSGGGGGGGINFDFNSVGSIGGFIIINTCFIGGPSSFIGSPGLVQNIIFENTNFSLNTVLFSSIQAAFFNSIVIGDITVDTVTAGGNSIFNSHASVLQGSSLTFNASGGNTITAFITNSRLLCNISLNAGVTLYIDEASYPILGATITNTGGTVIPLGNSVLGPTTSTNNALPRFDGTTGKLIKDSNVTLSDFNGFSGVTSILGAPGTISTTAKTVIIQALDGVLTGNGGEIDINAGAGGPDGGNGADIVLTAGGGTFGDTNGGNIYLNGGIPSGSGTNGTIFAMDDISGNPDDGSVLNIYTPKSPSIDSANLNIFTSSSAGNGIVGQINLVTGNSSGSVSGGDINIICGNGSTEFGGQLLLESGSGANGGSAIVLQAGDGTAGNANGGSVYLRTGDPSGVGVAGKILPQATMDMGTNVLTGLTNGVNPTDAVAFNQISSIYSGTYTPTLTNGTNVNASTPYQCQYMVINNSVTVSGKVDIDPTLAAVSTILDISLPVASTFGAPENCAGTLSSYSINIQAGAIKANTTTAQVNYIPVTDSSNQSFSFNFTYLII